MKKLSLFSIMFFTIGFTINATPEIAKQEVTNKRKIILTFSGNIQDSLDTFDKNRKNELLASENDRENQRLKNTNDTKNKRLKVESDRENQLLEDRLNEANKNKVKNLQISTLL
jgi:Skp family chaperone for outer membrane proteins